MGNKQLSRTGLRVEGAEKGKDLAWPGLRRDLGLMVGGAKEGINSQEVAKMPRP